MNTLSDVINNDVSARRNIVCWCGVKVKIYTHHIKAELAIFDQQPCNRIGNVQPCLSGGCDVAGVAGIASIIIKFDPDDGNVIATRLQGAALGPKATTV